MPDLQRKLHCTKTAENKGKFQEINLKWIFLTCIEPSFPLLLPFAVIKVINILGFAYLFEQVNLSVLFLFVDLNMLLTCR